MPALAERIARGTVELLLIAFDSLVQMVLPRAVPRAGEVLVVRVDGFGDFVLWMSAARALRTLYPAPQYRITLVASEGWADLARKQDIFDAVLPVDTTAFVRNPVYRARALYQVRAVGAQTAIQPMYARGVLRSDALIRATGAPERIGFEGGGRTITRLGRWFSDRWYTRLVPASATPLMELQRNAEFMRGLGVPLAACLPVLTAPRDELPLALQGKAYYVLCPSASRAEKVWPAERFSAISERLFERFGWHGVICGGRTDRELGENVARQSRAGLVNLCGETPINTLTTIIAHAKLVVGNDTGPAHLAPALGVPSVCIVGGGHFGRFFPYVVDEPVGELPFTVSHKMPCFGCNWRCIYAIKRNAPVPCVERVTADAVWNGILSVAVESVNKNVNVHL